MGPAKAQRAALAAETPGTGNRDKPHRHGPRLRRASPNELYDPADNGPAKQQIHKEDKAGVGLLAPDNRGQEVHQT